MTPMDTRELRQQRAQLIDDAKKILDKKDVSAYDRELVRQKTEESLALATKIQTAELENDECRSEAERKFATTRCGGGLRFRNHETGEEIRSVRHGESFRSSLKNVGHTDMSVGKLIFGAATGDWKGAEAEQRAYSAWASAGGGYLLNAEMSANVIDLARAASVVSAAGAITIPMESDELKIARVETDPTGYWTSENSEITESTGTFGLFNLRLNCLAVYCTASLELVRSAANAQSLIEGTVAKAIALKLDEAALNGQGTSYEPMGLLHSPQVGTYSVAGAISYDKLLRGCRQLWNSNIEPQSMIYDANGRAAIAMLKDGEGQYQVAPPEISRLKSYMTTQLSSTDTNNCMYIGDFSNCIFGIKNQVEIEVSGVADSVFKKKQVAIRGLLWADFCACRSGDVVRLTGITGSTD